MPENAENTDNANTKNPKTIEFTIQGRLAIVIAVVLILLLDIGLGFYFGKLYAHHVELAVREQVVKHALDSLKASYAVTEKSKDSVKTQIITQTNTIVQHEQEVIKQAATIKQLPFTKIGPDLKSRLEAAQAKPWVIDSTKHPTSGK